jgi:hypothetical protein
MQGFTTAELEEAKRLNEHASRDLAGGTAARETANDHVRGTVLFASAPFLAAVAQRFTDRTFRIGANVVALILLAYAVYSVVRLPRI